MFEVVRIGFYLSPKGSAGADKICLMSNSDWKLVSDKDKFCAVMPLKCSEVSVPAPETGYSIWPEADPEAVQYGTCDPAYGLEQKVNITVDAKADLSTLAPNLLAIANAEKDRLVALLADKAKFYGDRNINIPDFELQDGTYFKFTKLPASPIRVCSGGTNSGTIQNPCVFVSACGAVTKVAPFTGNATWAAQSTSTIDGPSQSSSETSYSSTSVTGTCGVGYDQAAAGLPQRTCQTYYRYTNETPPGSGAYADPKEALYQFWSIGVINNCVKSN